MLQSAQVTLESLNVKPVFLLDLNERDALIHNKAENDNLYTSPENQENIKLLASETLDLYNPKAKYGLTMRKLEQVISEQSPLAKLEILYHTLKFVLPQEIDTFWEGTSRCDEAKDRNIDIDNLQAITIFIIFQMKNPQMLVECFLISEFVSEGTKLSTRALFLNVVKASIDFLLEIDIQSVQKCDDNKTEL